MDRPLIATADRPLAEELARLAAAAGTPVEVVSVVDRLPVSWVSAPVVLVGDDLAPALAEMAVPRRPGVQVVCWSPVPEGVFRDALMVGAERVVELPSGAGQVAELLTDLGEAGRHEGSVVGVVGGSGGAGATTFACALGQVAAARGPTLVVDLDPLGPGCDRVLALDDAAGVRWDVFGTTSGRMSGRSLREAVPRREQLGLLVRGHGADPRRLAGLVGAPVLAAMADQRGLAEGLDLGLGPVRSRRGPLAQAAREVLQQLPSSVSAA